MAMRLEQSIGDGERALNLFYAVLVASKSTPSVWHEVRRGRCDCEGFFWRKNCRHIRIAECVRTGVS